MAPRSEHLLFHQLSGRRPKAPPVEPSEKNMSFPVPATLYRIGAAAGCGSAAVLLINAAKRAEVNIAV